MVINRNHLIEWPRCNGSVSLNVTYGMAVKDYETANAYLGDSAWVSVSNEM